MEEKSLVEVMAQLKNIGPKSAEDLVRAGIDSPEKLREIGAKEAFLRLCLSTKKFCFNACYLYALEGAIQNCDWRDISETKKRKFREFTAQLRKDLK